MTFRVYWSGSPFDITASHREQAEFYVCRDHGLHFDDFVVRHVV